MPTQPVYSTPLCISLIDITKQKEKKVNKSVLVWKDLDY